MIKLLIDQELLFTDTDPFALEALKECSVYHTPTPEGLVIPAQKITLTSEDMQELFDCVDGFQDLEFEYVDGLDCFGLRVINELRYN